MEPQREHSLLNGVNCQKVLITGARGRLARHAIAELKKDFSLVLTDRLEPEAILENYRQADLTDLSQTVAVMKGIDTVLHLAITSYPPSPKGVEPSPQELADYQTRMLQVNPLSTFHVFEAARLAHVKRVIYVSSLTVYFGDKHRSHYQETDAPDPPDLYACTKLLGEHIGRVYFQTHGLEVLTLRLGQPYPANNIYDETWQKSRRARSMYVTVEDFARATRCAVECDVPFGVFNIVSASDNQRLDIRAAQSIGYRPIGYFSGEGLSFHPDGKVPRSDAPVATHD